MKIPNYLREPCYTPGAMSLNTVARMLEIEATVVSKQGSSEGARALRYAAEALRKIDRETSPAQAFDWPEPSQRDGNG